MIFRSAFLLSGFESGEKVCKKDLNDQKLDTFYDRNIEGYQREYQMSSYSDSIRDQYTKHFIDALEKGDIPWHRPWNGVSQFPHNWTTGKPYRGFNPVYLMMAETARGFNDCRWGGKRQILDSGARILRDEFRKPTCILAPVSYTHLTLPTKRIV